ncbi:DNA primase [Chloroflexota bacterium]
MVGAIDEIKQRLDIVEVVSGYLPGLAKAGRNFKAPCPFHVEKVPSFYVFPERQSWHCFGACATGGDVFSFIMRKEGVDFGEALRILARKAGVSLAPPQRSEDQKQEDRLKEINEAASEYYHGLLLQSREGERARDYLEKRGVTQKTIEDFRLGFSPDSWEASRNELARKSYRENELLAAGLLVAKEQGRAYDRFRNRLMFPIRGMDGRVSGFGARALDDSLPKYLNSPQTPVFDKSATLYGIDRARSGIRKKDSAVVVEGYMDAIVAHQYGFDNVVASLGTALTEKQVNFIKRLTKNLTLALDADAAGEMATLRGIEVASHTFDSKVVPLPTPSGLVRYESILDAEIRVVVLPQGKDPDDVIRESTEAWERMLSKAVPVVEYTFDVVASRLDLTKVKDKSLALDQLLPLVAEIKRPVMQAHYLQKLSRLVGVDEQELAATLSKTRRPLKSTQRGERASPSSLIPSLLPNDPLAEYCLSLLLRYPDLRANAADLSEELFPHSESRQLYITWRDTDDIDAMYESIDTSLHDYLAMVVGRSVPEIDEREQEDALDDCVRRLRKRWLQDLQTKEEALASNAQAEGNAAELEELKQSGEKINAQLLEVLLQERRRNSTPRG